jgi:hypothetical protein
VSEQSIPDVLESNLTHDEKVAAKPTIMAAIGKHYANIEAGKVVVGELEAAAAVDICKVVKLFGKGPHKMPLAGRPNMAVMFRKDGDTYRMTAREIT